MEGGKTCSRKTLWDCLEVGRLVRRARVQAGKDEAGALAIGIGSRHGFSSLLSAPLTLISPILNPMPSFSTLHSLKPNCPSTWPRSIPSLLLRCGWRELSTSSGMRWTDLSYC